MLPEKVPEHIFFEDEPDTVVKSPEDKVEARPVPESCQHPDDQEISYVFSCTYPVPAERNVDVFPEPAAEGNMPSAPEIRDGHSGIRVVKVFGKCKSQKPPEPDRHVRVSAEVEIELQGIGEGPRPGGECRQGGGGQGGDLGKEAAENICKKDLFGKSLHKEEKTQPHLHEIDGMVLQLLLDVLIAHDRPGDQLREHGDIETEVRDGALRFDFPPVHVDHIGQGLKGVK